MLVTFVKYFIPIISIIIAIISLYFAFNKKKSKKSREKFKNIRNYIKQNRNKLRNIALEFYTNQYNKFINDYPLLIKYNWLPEKPIEINQENIKTNFSFENNYDNDDIFYNKKILPQKEEKNLMIIQKL